MKDKIVEILKSHVHEDDGYVIYVDSILTIASEIHALYTTELPTEEEIKRTIKLHFKHQWLWTYKTLAEAITKLIKGER